MLDRQFFARIGDGAIFARGQWNRGAVTFRDPDYMKDTGRRHPRVTPLSCPDREGFRSVVPAERHHCVLALFVVVVVTLIFVESEGSIGPGVYPQFDRIIRLFAGPLHIRTIRKNGTGPHEDWQMPDRSSRLDRLSAIKCLASPEIGPARSRWQDDSTGYSTRRSHGVD